MESNNTRVFGSFVKLKMASALWCCFIIPSTRAQPIPLSTISCPATSSVPRNWLNTTALAVGSCWIMILISCKSLAIFVPMIVDPVFHAVRNSDGRVWQYDRCWIFSALLNGSYITRRSSAPVTAVKVSFIERWNPLMSTFDSSFLAALGFWSSSDDPHTVLPASSASPKKVSSDLIIFSRHSGHAPYVEKELVWD